MLTIKDILQPENVSYTDSIWMWAAAHMLHKDKEFGYRFVDYIKSTGTQYIQTDIVPTYSDKAELQLKLDTQSPDYSVNGDQYLFGYFHGNQSFTVIFKGDGYKRPNYENVYLYDGYMWHGGMPSESFHINGAYIGTDPFVCILQRGVCRWGEQTTNISVFDIECPQPSVGMPIFAGLHWDGTIIPVSRRDMYLYSFKLYNGNTLLHDLRPVERKSDNELGMFDMITNKFYANAGTGTFVKGEYIG